MHVPVNATQIEHERRDRTATSSARRGGPTARHQVVEASRMGEHVERIGASAIGHVERVGGLAGHAEVRSGARTVGHSTMLGRPKSGTAMKSMAWATYSGPSQVRLSALRRCDPRACKKFLNKIKGAPLFDRLSGAPEGSK